MKVGVIGSGAISDTYLQNMIGKFNNLEVVAISSKHLERAQKKADMYGIEACTVEELLANPQIEMVVILTPVGAHYQLIKDALMAGKHVYTEKTMTADLKEAKELVELADSKGVYLGSAPDTFLGAAWQTARHAIAEGILGEINSFAISTNRNNDFALSLIGFLRQPGAGILNDFGVYYLTVLTSLLGPVARVGAIVSAPYRQHINIIATSPEFGQMMDTPNESQVSAVIQLKSGITGTLHMDADSHLVDQSYFTIHGTRGILVLTDPSSFGGQVRFLPVPIDHMKPMKEIVLWNFSPYEEDSRGLGPSEMAEAIALGRNNRASKEMAYHVQEVLAGILNGGERGAFTDINSTMVQPEPLESNKVPIVNIGHASFQMNNEEAMFRFYEDVLGMKKLFTLTYGDLISFEIEKGNKLSEDMEKRRTEPQKPWLTYMKLADHQYVEFFHHTGNTAKQIEDRRQYYGYTKLNFEVDSIKQIRDKLVASGVEIVEDIHEVLDGSLELTVFDPDGNEVQFIQYGTVENAMIPLAEDQRESCSLVKYTTQVAYQVQNAVNMVNFYCRGLGLKKVKTVTYVELYEEMIKTGINDEQLLKKIKMKGNRPWIDFIEVAPHQYIEFFHTEGEEKQELRNLHEYVGYQHLCLEVTDIHAAWNACLANGLKPEGEISLGLDGAYQFWLVDPDGNLLELMEYVEGAKQLL